jgi:tetratricopeptide (TPR) repeat protein
MHFRSYIFILICCFVFGVGFVNGQSSVREITVMTEPNAIVWLNDVNRGATDEAGKLVVKPIPPGSHKLRVRADGFKEITQTLTPTQKGDIKIALAKTTDKAELAFQEAEKMASEDTDKAKELYQKAIQLRSNYPQAYIGLARLLSGMGETDAALATIKNLRKVSPNYAEASAVEGRIYITLGEEEKGIASFERAIREGKGVQPEAYAGLGLFYKEKAETAGNSGKFDDEKFYYNEAAEALKKSVKQLSGAPDAIILYQFIGVIYEKMHEYEKAIAVYEDFLKTFPDTTEASAVQSFIVQIKKQMQDQ